VRRILGTAVALACVALLTSCSLLPGIPAANPFGSSEHPDAVMQHISDAVKSHDAAALKKLFSTRAREKATDLDSGLKYFLSVFPSGKLTWAIENGAPGSADENEHGYTEEMYAFYEVSANGKNYTVYFADVTVNTNDTKNVGIYALAVGPYNADPATSPTAASTAFLAWANSHQLDDNNGHG
jgi:Domain of unknown function (DUF5104)